MKYLIKKTYIATQDSKYYKKGYKEVWFLAKGIVSDKNELTSYVSNQGYERKCDVSRRLKYENKSAAWESAQGFWAITNEIIEVA